MSSTDPAPRSRVLRTTVIAVVVLAVTFASGVFVGIAADRVLLRRRPPVPPFATAMMVQRMDRHLDLTAEQRRAIEGILEKRHERINALWGSVRPRVREEIEATNAEIARVLTPEQRARFEKMKIHMGPPGRGRRHR